MWQEGELKASAAAGIMQGYVLTLLQYLHYM